MFTVYMAINQINGKRYIGVTGKGMRVRRLVHFNKAKAGGRECPRFYDAIRKYGVDAFVWKVLCTRKGQAEAYRRELIYVEVLKPEYNVVAGGSISAASAGWNKRPVLCLEDGIIHESASAAARFYKGDFSDIAKAAKGEARLGAGRHFQIYCDDLTEPERLSLIAFIDAHFVQKRRRVQIRRARNATVVDGRDALGRSAAGPMSNARPVICLDDGKLFPSISAAAKNYDVDGGALSELCRGLRFRKTVGGMKFKYADVVN